MEVNFQPLQDLAGKVCQLKINNESLTVSLSDGGTHDKYKPFLKNFIRWAFVVFLAQEYT